MSSQNDFTKTIDLVIQTSKLTKEVFEEAMRDFTQGKRQKQGKLSFGEICKRSGGKLESIEVTDNNIRDFLSTAKKYDVDFSLKRDKTTQPPTYHVFFQTNNAANFNKAFFEYANKKQEQIESKSKTPYSLEKLQEKARQIATEPHKKKGKERVRNLKKETVR